MIRTIWLGFTFLIVLAGVGAFRFAFGNFDAANASAIARPEVNYIVVAKSIQPPPANSELLPAPFVMPAPAPADTVLDTGKVDAAKADVAEVNVEAVKDENIWPEPPSQTLPALVATGRPGPDWRDASAQGPRRVTATDPRRAKPVESRQKQASEPRQKPDQKAVRKNPKSESVVTKDQEAAEPRTCQAAEFDAFRWAFKLPTGCWS